MTTLYSFLDQHSLYVVLIIVLVIWAGIFLYLYRLDKRISKLYAKSGLNAGDLNTHKEEHK
ncbi:MAG: CcmD family protein [Candidatus Kryptoniota bacterium]